MSEPARQDAYADLPGILPEVAEAAGVDAALQLAAELGGTAVHVSRKPRAGTKLVDAVGLDAAQRIATRFGGETVPVPSAKRHVVAALLRAGYSTQEIARRLKLDRNTVARMRDRAGDGRQPFLFDLPE